MSGSPVDGVVLIGHGSRDTAAAAEFLALAAELAEVLGVPVVPGFLEFAGVSVPSIQTAFDRCAALGCRRVAAVPAILFAGGHGSQDVPRQVARARDRLPWLEIRSADLVGIDDGLLDSLVRRAVAALDGLPPLPAENTALLLVTSGSARREANADVFKAARLLADRADGRFVIEVAFLRLSRPYLQDAAVRCARLGARRVVVLPLFLNTGLLARRIPRKLVWLRQRLPNIEFVDVPHLGVDPVLVRLLAQRAHEAFSTPLERGTRTPFRLAQERCRPAGPAVGVPA